MSSPKRHLRKSLFCDLQLIIVIQNSIPALRDVTILFVEKPTGLRRTNESEQPFDYVRLVIIILRCLGCKRYFLYTDHFPAFLSD